MRKIGGAIIVLTVTVASAAIVMASCSRSGESNAGRHPLPKEPVMKLTIQNMPSPGTIPPIDAAAPQAFDTATFGLGWFWGVDAQFGAIEGVIRTRVGYAGGQTENPDYGNIGDHTEAVQVDFDPEKISYANLLAVFWESHRPDSRSWKRQYLNAVFYHDARQEQEALASRAALEDRLGRGVRTEVLPLRSFTRAEDYHQKYILKRASDLMRELTRMYPNHTDLVDSTAVARLNGYVGGHGSPEQFAREIESLGLSPEGRKRVGDIVRGKGPFN